MSESATHTDATARRWRAHPRWHAIVRFFAKNKTTSLFWVIGVLFLAWLVFGTIGLFQDHGLAFSSGMPELNQVSDIGAVLAYLTKGALRALVELLSYLVSAEPAHLFDGSVLTGLSRICGLSGFLLLAVGGLSRWAAGTTRALFARNLLERHVVIIGLGGAGRALLEDCNRNRPGQVVVAIDPRRPTVESIRSAGLGVLAFVGNGRDADVFELLAVHKAAHIFISTGDDHRNVDIAGSLRKHLNSHPAIHRDQGVIIAPLVNDRTLLDRICDDTRFLEISKNEQATPSVIRPFSSDETAVRRLFLDRPIAEFTALTVAKRSHIFIVGFGSLGETVLRHALQATLQLESPAPRITIVAEDAPEAKRRFNKRYPGLAKNNLKACGLGDIHIEFAKDTLDQAIDRLAQPAEDWAAHFEVAAASAAEAPFAFTPPQDLERFWPKDPITAIFVCIEEESRSLEIALSLQRTIDRTRCVLAPTFVRLTEDVGLSSALAPSKTEVELSQVIEGFGLDREVFTWREVFEGPWKSHARTGGLLGKLHRAYEEFSDEWDPPAAPAHSLPSRSSPATGEFHALAMTYSRANLTLAEHIAVKMRALGYRPTSWRHRNSETPGDGQGSIEPTLDFLGLKDQWIKAAGGDPKTTVQGPGRETLIALSEFEHKRWILERLIDGWKTGLERDNVEKIHPALRPWNQLTPKTQYFDERHILELDQLVVDDWKKDVAIGVVGPRQTDKQFEQRIRTEVKTKLSQLRDQLRPCAITLISCLAPGADLIFVEVALQVFNSHQVRIIVPQPMPAESLMAGMGAEEKKTYEATRARLLEGRPTADAAPPKERFSREDTWIIDLLPPFFSPRLVTPLADDVDCEPQARKTCNLRRRRLRENQYRLGTHYVAQRSDYLFCIQRNGDVPVSVETRRPG